MKYVALLRGINVGGKATVPMLALKEVFAKLAFANVKTYINSGNVIFESDADSQQLASLIEGAITKQFKLAVPALVRPQTNIALLCAKIPASWTNDNEQKTDVMFLWDDIDDESILQKVSINPAIENALYLPGALVWNIGRDNVTRGGGIKLIKTDIYTKMTVRNVNTVRKLNELMTTS